MTFTATDGEARKLAYDAMRHAEAAVSQISAHERVCVERYESINNKLDDLREDSEQRRDSVRGIYGLLWAAVGALVLILLAIVGYLIDRNLPRLPLP